MNPALEKIAQFPSRRARMQNVLDALEVLGGSIESPSGKAAGDLKALCDEEVRGLTASGFSNMINDLAEGGLLSIHRHGKRTLRISLTEPNEAVVESEPEPEPEEEYEVTSEDLGMRPGRLAARIEKAVPELVDQAVRSALGDMVSTALASLGFHSGLDPEVEAEMQSLRSQTAAMEGTIRDLEYTVRIERIRGDAARTELNALLRKSNDGMIASKTSLTAHQVPKEYKEVAQWALENGWTIHRTRSGHHLAWKSPEGKMNFGGSTPSDNNSAMLLRLDLERMGLPKNRGLA